MLKHPSSSYQSFSKDSLLNSFSTSINIVVLLALLEIPIRFLSEDFLIKESGNRTRKKIIESKIVPLILPRNSPNLIQILLIKSRIVELNTHTKPKTNAMVRKT